MSGFSVWIPGIPKPQPRPRRAADGGVYNPETAASWKSIVGLMVKTAAGRPIEGPVSVSIEFHLPRPQRLNRKKDPRSPIPHGVKPDLDNLVKSTLDAITQTRAVWVDDSQVYRLHVEKFFQGIGNEPGARVKVEPVEVRG